MRDMIYHTRGRGGTSGSSILRCDGNDDSRRSRDHAVSVALRASFFIPAICFVAMFAYAIAFRKPRTGHRAEMKTTHPDLPPFDGRADRDVDEPLARRWS